VFDEAIIDSMTKGGFRTKEYHAQGRARKSVLRRPATASLPATFQAGTETMSRLCRAHTDASRLGTAAATATSFAASRIEGQRAGDTWAQEARTCRVDIRQVEEKPLPYGTAREIQRELPRVCALCIPENIPLLTVPSFQCE